MVNKSAEKLERSAALTLRDGNDKQSLKKRAYLD